MNALRILLVLQALSDSEIQAATRLDRSQAQLVCSYNPQTQNYLCQRVSRFNSCPDKAPCPSPIANYKQFNNQFRIIKSLAPQPAILKLQDLNTFDIRTESRRILEIGRRLADLGRYVEAIQMLRGELNGAFRLVALYNTACYQSLAKKPQDALETLEILVQEINSKQDAKKYWRLFEEDSDLAILQSRKAFLGLQDQLRQKQSRKPGK